MLKSQKWAIEFQQCLPGVGSEDRGWGDGKGWSKISSYKMNTFWESSVQSKNYT